MKNKIKLWVGLSIIYISLSDFDKYLHENAIHFEEELGIWAANCSATFKFN